ncbi:MAG: hypothetical protein ACREUH_09685 [Burkholderiales bacterium]
MLCAISIIAAVFPVVPAALAAWVAKANKCALHEGFINPCVMFGVDIGGLLYAMGVSMWLLFLSVPVGALGLLAGIVWFIIACFRKEQHG